MADVANSFLYDGEKLLIYAALGDFTHHLVEQCKVAIVIGLLEAIQNISANAKIDPKFFEPYLASETKKLWDSMNDFCNGKNPTVK